MRFSSSLALVYVQLSEAYFNYVLPSSFETDVIWSCEGQMLTRACKTLFIPGLMPWQFLP